MSTTKGNGKRRGKGSESLRSREESESPRRYGRQHRSLQVRDLLADEPGNSEYADMEKELEEVIALTEELLVTAKKTDQRGLVVQLHASPSQNFGRTQYDTGSSQHGEFSVGIKVQAVWSEDGEWYDGTIEAHTPNGYYVSFDDWGNKEEPLWSYCYHPSKQAFCKFAS